MRPWLALLLALGACGQSAGGPQDPADPDASVDAGAADAGLDAAPVDRAAHCAIECNGPAPEGQTCFGSELTSAFGRLDGTLLAVQRPSDTGCALPNGDHLIVQVLMHGAAYRMVVNVLSDGRNGTDTRLRFADVAAPLPAPAWEEGWHPGLVLDYVDTLDVHVDDFTPYEMDALMDEVASRLTLDQPISVYGTSEDRPSGAHLIHRNTTGQDGAIVVGPTSDDPHFLLFHFDGQVF
jgi:hypothetical protein